MQNLTYAEFKKTEYNYEVVSENKKYAIIDMCGIEVHIPIEDFFGEVFHIYYNYHYQISTRGEDHMVEGDRLVKYIEETKDFYGIKEK